MLATLYIFLFWIAGYILISRFLPKLFREERLVIGYVLGSTLGVWLVFLLSLSFGSMVATIISLALLSLLALLMCSRTNASLNGWLLGSFTIKQRVGYVVYSLMWMGVFFWLFSSHMFWQKADGLYSGGSSYGDLALHATFVYKFSQADRLDLVSPIYAQTVTTYPLLVDFYSAWLLRQGFDLQRALFWPGFLGAVSISQLLFMAGHRYTRSVLAALTGSVIFLANGGIGFYYFLKDFLASDLPLFSFLLKMDVQYAHLAEYNLRWSNVVCDYFLPQRGYLVGFGVFLTVVILFNQLHSMKGKSFASYMGVGVLLGSLPLFHIHSFVVGVGVTAWLTLIHWLQKKNVYKGYLLAVLTALLMASPQLIYQFLYTTTDGFVRFQIGWMKSGENIFLFWLRNMGAGFLFWFFSGLYLLKKRVKYRQLNHLFVPLSILFIITNAVILQPHEYDNMKLMLYSYWIFAVATGALLASWWGRGRILRMLVIFIIGLLTITGMLSILREGYTSWKIAGSADQQIASMIRQVTDPKAIFLAAPIHNHPVPMLAGRSVLMGYPGWLWTHGINYTQTYQHLKRMYLGGDQALRLMNDYNVSYVFIGNAEMAEFTIDVGYFDFHYPIVASNESGTVYYVREVNSLMDTQ